jgi:hypothetical protein
MPNNKTSYPTEEDESHAQKSLGLRKRLISFKDSAPVKQPMIVNKQLIEAQNLLDSP